MMNKPIKRIDDIETAPASSGDISPGPLRKAPGKSKNIAAIAIPDKSWFKRSLKALKRTFTGRNTTGKIITHGLVAAIGVATGLNVQPLLGLFNQAFTYQSLNQPPMFHFNLLSIILIFVSAGLGYLVKHFKSKNVVSQVISDVNEIVGQIRKARNPESEAGTKITEKEKQVILQSAETKGLELIKRLFRQFFGDRNDTQATN